MKNRNIIMILGLIGIIAAMGVSFGTSVGPNDGSTFADDTAVGTISWTSPSNAQTSDNVRATVSLSALGDTISYYLKATGFGFSIPSDATVNGIVVEIEKSASRSSGNNYIIDHSVKIAQGGTLGGSDKADTITGWPTTDAYTTYGASNDLWGLTWTAAQVNAAGFGVGISAEISPSATLSTAARVDHIRVTVYYTEAAGAGAKDCTVKTDGSNMSVPCNCTITRKYVLTDWFSVNETGGTLWIDSSNVTFSKLNITPSQCTIALNGTFIWGWKP